MRKRRNEGRTVALVSVEGRPVEGWLYCHSSRHVTVRYELLVAIRDGTAWEAMCACAEMTKYQIRRCFDSQSHWLTARRTVKRIREWKLEHLAARLPARVLERAARGRTREAALARIAGSTDPRLTNIAPGPGRPAENTYPAKEKK